MLQQKGTVSLAGSVPVLIVRSALGSAPDREFWRAPGSKGGGWLTPLKRPHLARSSESDRCVDRECPTNRRPHEWPTSLSLVLKGLFHEQIPRGNDADNSAAFDDRQVPSTEIQHH
jgi:hypothetical protein